MSRYRQTMSELLEQVRQQDFSEGHSDKDFKPYPDWKKTTGGRYPRFKHSQKGEIEVDRYGEWLHSNKSGKTIAFYRNHFPKTNTTGGTSMKLTDYLKKINEEVIDESDAYDNNRYMMKKYGGQILARPDNSNTKDGKDHVYAPNAQIAKQLYKQGKKVYREESDHEVSMARGELEAIADKASQLAGALQGISDEGNPLEAWVQSKITKAKDYINSVSDYLMYNPDMKQNEETEVNEKTYGWTLVSKAKDLAKKFANNMTKAVAEIEKLERGLSKNPTVDAELRKYNEEVEIDEKISDIFKANKEGESIDDIAKRLKLSISMVKKLIGEAKDEEEKKEEPKKEENKESEIQSLKSQVAMLKQKLENEKNKAIKPEPNPETGEVPLTIGIAHAEFK